MQNNLPYPHSFPTKEETAFLKMARASDEEFPSLWRKWKDSVDWYQIDFATAKLVSFLYPRLTKLGIRDELTDRMRGVHKSAWVKNQLFLHAAKEIAEICHAENIPVLMLKGIPLVLEVYEDSGSRPLGDADILVKPEDGKRLTDILLAKGWKFSKEWAADKHNPVPSVYKVIKATELQSERGVGVDIHYNIFAGDHGMRLLDVFLLRDLPSLSFPEYFWRNTVPMNLMGTPCLRLSNEDTLIHIIVHGSEGNTYRGFRWVLDTLLLLEKLPMDWQRVLHNAKEFGYVIELKLAFAYLTQHFNVNVPSDFLEQLHSLSIKKDQIKKYYQVANTEHTKRVRFLGNIPLLWYAYWKYEPFSFFLLKFFGFPTYLRSAWGLKSTKDMFGFAVHHLLRKFKDKDPHFFSNLKRVAKDSSYVVGGKLVSFAASFGVITFMALMVPRDIVGSYNYLIAVLAIVSIATLPGMNEALVRAVGRGYDGSVRSMMKRRLLWGMGGSVLAVIVGGITWLTGNPSLGMAFLIAAPFVPLTDTFSTFAINFWQGKKNFARSAIVGAAYYVGLALLSIVVILLTQELVLLVLGIMAAQAIAGYAVYGNIRTSTKDTDPESEKLGMHLTVMQAVNVLANNIDKVLLWILAGPVTVAIYTFAATPVSKVWQMLPIGIVALPHLSGRPFTSEVKRAVLKNTLLLFCLSLPTTAAVIVAAPAIYSILFPLYPESVLYFQLLFLGLALSPTVLLRSALVAFEQTRALYVTDVAIPVLKILFMIVLTAIWGIYGLVAGLLLVSVLSSSVTLGLFLHAKTVQ